MTRCVDQRSGSTGTPAERACDPGGGTADDRVRTGTRRLLIAFALLTALATHRLLVLGGHTDRYWPWTIQNRATVGFLAAAYAAGFVLSVLSLRQRSWSHLRVAVATVTAFTVFTLVATLVHAHRLHFSSADPMARAAAWLWVTVYVVVPLAGLSVLARQEQVRSRRDVVRNPMSPWLRLVLGCQGAVLLALGLVLFLGGLSFHHGMASMGAWPWALTPLSAQAIGAWLMAFGIGAALVIGERDLSRLQVPAIAYAAFGVCQCVVLLRYGTWMSAGAWAYGALSTVIAVTGGFGWWKARGLRRRAA
jgi:hypothetical protein